MEIPTADLRNEGKRRAKSRRGNCGRKLRVSVARRKGAFCAKDVYFSLGKIGLRADGLKRGGESRINVDFDHGFSGGTFSVGEKKGSNQKLGVPPLEHSRGGHEAR